MKLSIKQYRGKPRVHVEIDSNYIDVSAKDIMEFIRLYGDCEDKVHPPKDGQEGRLRIYNLALGACQGAAWRVLIAEAYRGARRPPPEEYKENFNVASKNGVMYLVMSDTDKSEFCPSSHDLYLMITNMSVKDVGMVEDFIRDSALGDDYYSIDVLKKPTLPRISRVVNLAMRERDRNSTCTDQPGCHIVKGICLWCGGFQHWCEKHNRFGKLNRCSCEA